MQVTRQDLSSTKVTLKVNADAKDLAPIKTHVLKHFATDVKVPGFRAGTAPAALLEKHVNQQAFMDEFMEHAINDLYGKAVATQKLRPVGQPDVQLKKFVPYTDMEFEATQEVIGAVTLPNYKIIKLPKIKATVTAKDVDDVIENLQKQDAQRTEVTRAAKDGDEAVIDFAGKDSAGLPVPGADGKDYPLLLGSKSFIPGFEENVIGMKAGDKKDFTVTFPADYGVAALQSKKVTFGVTVSKVSELLEPKLDDVFAAKVGPFKTVAELKADVKRNLAAEKQNAADRDYENQLVLKIAEKTKVEIPDTLIDDQIKFMEDDEKRNLVYRGQTWQEHLDAEGLSEQQHRDRQRPDAIARVKAGLTLSEIADKEGFVVTPEELEVRIQGLKGQYQDSAMQAELDKPENRRDIANRLLTEKTIQKLVDYASK